MSHLREVIRDHLKSCIGIIVADAEPCIGMGASIPAKKRISRRAAQANVEAIWFQGQYAVAVILCPGDTTTMLAAFAKKHNVNLDRVHFYHPPETDAFAALRAWRTAGFSVHSVTEVKSWGNVNQHFAAHWNLIIHDTLCQRASCVLHVLE